jgi:hypothetical protein
MGFKNFLAGAARLSDPRTPEWLIRVEKFLGWIAVPNLAFLLVSLQIAGFIFITYEPEWAVQLALIPSAVLAGEYWRLITFLALPLSTSPIWMLFVLLFVYMIVDLLEDQWGAFRTTLYVLVSWAVTVGFSMVTGYPVLSAEHFESSLFLAAAMLYPEMPISIFFVIPAKMKWLAWISIGFVVIEMLQGSWLDRFHILAIYSNFMLFFGPAAAEVLQSALKRWKWERDRKRQGPK